MCHGYLKNSSLRGVSNEAARIGLAAKGINRLQAGGRRTHGAELPAAPASASRQIRITHIECHLIGKYKKPNRVVLMHLLNKRLYTTHFKVTNAVSFNNVHHSTSVSAFCKHVFQVNNLLRVFFLLHNSL